MKCPKCGKPIGPDDSLCPSCGSLLLLEKRPTRPEEEQGWTVRLLASVMGRIGCGVMIAQNALVIIVAAALAPQAVAFLGGTDRTPDLSPVDPLILAAGTMDLIGLGLLAVALIILGAGSVFMRRRDPFTDEEVMISPTVAALPMASGLFLVLWLLVTAGWRVIYPVQLGRPAAQILADFAAYGAAGAPSSISFMAWLWVVAAVAMVGAASCLGFFVRRLPSKLVAPGHLRPASWRDFVVFNLVLTLGIAAFLLGWIGYDTRGGPAQIVFLTFLATKITVLPFVGAFAYWNLFTRFNAFGKLSLLVPMMKAFPQDASSADAMMAGGRRGIR